MRKLLALPLLLALASPAVASNDPQCFPPPALVVRDGTLYVSVRDGDCHWTTYAVPLPTRW